MSLIYYKFKSAKDYSRHTFDGFNISVYELKQEILRAKRLSPDEFDLAITNAQSGEDYTSDKAQIPKGTHVIVRRIPNKGPRYPAGLGGPGYGGVASGNSNGVVLSMSKQSPSRGGGSPFPVMRPPPPTASSQPQAPPGMYLPGLSAIAAGTVSAGASSGRAAVAVGEAQQREGAAVKNAEDDLIDTMFQRTSEQWEHQQKQMEKYTIVSTPCSLPDAGPRCYCCYSTPRSALSFPLVVALMRLSNSGGVRIPKSFLKPVDKLEEGKNALVTGEGKLVVATANEQAWESSQKFTRKIANPLDDVSAVDSTQIPQDLQCPICCKIFTDASRVPCCQRVYCSECIDQALLSDDPKKHFVCPGCGAKNIVPDSVVADEDVRKRVGNFMREYIAKQELEEEKRRQEERAKAATSATGSSSSSAATSASPAPASSAATHPENKARVTSGLANNHQQNRPSAWQARPQHFQMHNKGVLGANGQLSGNQNWLMNMLGALPMMGNPMAVMAAMGGSYGVRPSQLPTLPGGAMNPQFTTTPQHMQMWQNMLAMGQNGMVPPRPPMPPLPPGQFSQQQQRPHAPQTISPPGVPGQPQPQPPPPYVSAAQGQPDQQAGQQGEQQQQLSPQGDRLEGDSDTRTDAHLPLQSHDRRSRSRSRNRSNYHNERGRSRSPRRTYHRSRSHSRNGSKSQSRRDSNNNDTSHHLNDAPPVPMISLDVTPPPESPHPASRPSSAEAHNKPRHASEGRKNASRPPSPPRRRSRSRLNARVPSPRQQHSSQSHSQYSPPPLPRSLSSSRGYGMSRDHRHPRDRSRDRDRDLSRSRSRRHRYRDHGDNDGRSPSRHRHHSRRNRDEDNIENTNKRHRRDSKDERSPHRHSHRYERQQRMRDKPAEPATTKPISISIKGSAAANEKSRREINYDGSYGDSSRRHRRRDRR
ncbi:Retinoblastoma-binding protein [Spiromyces aspiralis]|uniref:Retinoblastoma-binding protein n=1 Tax=Spiromyces aspiralis TaxID=68401 RepID=A0ACC1HNY8_9FUNG|nr:Retinoblastoma-binding protein [Spiromyces aspiralis]